MAARPESVSIGQTVAKGMPWLDDVATIIKRTYEPLLGENAPRPPRDFLYGTWLGHPLHAAVVTVPMGAWTATMVLDLLREDKAADVMLGLGIAGAAGAAVTGAAQYQDATSNTDARRLGALHALLNFATTGLMAGSLVLRRQGNRRAGVALSTLALGISATAAWLGGELAYGLGIGVDHTAFQKQPTKWTDVAALDELKDGTPRRVEADGVPVLLLRQGDRLRAIGAVCPHLGGPLDEGEIEGNSVTCPWHASVFSLVDGALIHGPATVPATAYEAKIVDGRVSVRANAARPGAVLIGEGESEVTGKSAAVSA